MPDAETRFLLLGVFGPGSRPVRKCQRMLYWLPRMRHINPHPLPAVVPPPGLAAARLGLRRIASDPDAHITVYQVGRPRGDTRGTRGVCGDTRGQAGRGRGGGGSVTWVGQGTPPGWHGVGGTGRGGGCPAEVSPLSLWVGGCGDTGQGTVAGDTVSPAAAGAGRGGG